MKHILKFKQKCKTCNGTGLYVGLAECDSLAVVCHNCKGKGYVHTKIEYEDFEGRKLRDGVRWVVERNPVRIYVGGNENFKSQNFGGMSYEDWLSGKKFSVGMEMREYTCPYQWYQAVDYKKVPRDWEGCSASWGRTFSECANFSTKDKCWERWDKENKK